MVVTTELGRVLAQETSKFIGDVSSGILAYCLDGCGTDSNSRPTHSPNVLPDLPIRRILVCAPSISLCRSACSREGCIFISWNLPIAKPRFYIGNGGGSNEGSYSWYVSDQGQVVALFYDFPIAKVIP